MRATVVKAVCTLGLATSLFPTAASGQTTNGQLWGDFTLQWKPSSRRTVDVDFEPKVLVIIPEGNPGWAELTVTPKFTYALAGWLDVGGELLTGHTAQTDDLNSVELTPRVDLHIHLFSREIVTVLHDRERPPKRKIVIRDLVRFEYRNIFYNQDKPESSSGRLRNRLELLIPINKERLTDDGARYVLSDWEWFEPVGPDVTERFANQQRIRAGLGHRRSYNWDLQVLYVWQRSRNTAGSGFKTSDHAIDVRFKRVF